MTLDEVAKWVTTGLAPLFGIVFVQQRKQVNSLQAELKGERDDCRQDREEYRSEVKEARKETRALLEMVVDLASRNGATDIAHRARSLSPPPMAAVKPEEKS